MADRKVRVGILGASGYTGADLVRLLLRHPHADIRVMTAERSAGKPIGEVFPHLAGFGLPDLVKVEDAGWTDVDLAFCGLPHGTTQEIIAALPPSVRVVDLSADFRLTDTETYAEWYGHPHRAPDLQRQAVYGLTEWTRDQVRDARLVANPGCYPTAVLLALLPLVGGRLIDNSSIIVDAKSGVSGAGRSVKEANLFTEVSEAMHAYGVGRHRHMPEMEQELSRLAGEPIEMSFTPHLVPMNRGEFVTAYVKLADGAGVDDLRDALRRRYEGEPFVRVLGEGGSPATRHVRGSNLCILSVFPDRRAGHAIVLSVIDNLVKGSSGQAIQNMNVMFGLPETEGLEQVALFP
ncbi:N-acetyl-gamma-glutamyl-phosphate reductase [Inquilinus sp. CAU 1745]|uniref:N-acetyl-gamma-glutamyl-phosphate reductase n=1 Tax=Inquilinus sp. CAU 1745 TaxID=3140369 RepID=UPI00325A7C16